MTSDPDSLQSRWYYDSRNRKVYFPITTDDDTVRFVTAWHREEVRDALEGGALVPLEEVGPPYLQDRTTAIELVDSFRLLDDTELAALADAARTDDQSGQSDESIASDREETDE